ncbi:chitinase-3-like protein 1 [Ornithodoros turicata]|uniref:chitinase-3-like protein 1 n=1 Tax=Ornithodoros turicata TaxID=34597 RepID=UPI00313A44D4
MEGSRSTAQLDAKANKPETKPPRTPVVKTQLTRQQVRQIIQARVDAKTRERGKPHRTVYYVWYFANVIWAVLAFPIGISLITYVRVQRKNESAIAEPLPVGLTGRPPVPTGRAIVETAYCNIPSIKIDKSWKPPFLDIPETFPKAVPSNRSIFCVFNHTSYQRHEAFRTGYINGHLCTHLMYSSAKLSDDVISSANQEFDVIKEGFLNLASLKSKYPHLKVLISVGEYERGSSVFSQMAANEARRSRFVAHAVSWLRENDYDGINIEWMNPADRCGSSADVANFVQLVQQLRHKLGDKYLICITLPPSKVRRTLGYDLHALAPSADYFLVDTRNLHDMHPNVTHCQVPLDAEGPSLTSVLREVLSELPANSSRKVCFGVSLAGISFTVNTSVSTYHSERRTIIGPGLEGNLTGTKGRLAFFEICQFEGSTKMGTMDVKEICSYQLYDDYWIGYESKFSLVTKLSEMFRKEEFKELCVVVWEIDMDDFKGRCKMGSTPLLKTIYDEASGQSDNQTSL